VVEDQVADVRRDAQLGHARLYRVAAGMQEEVLDPGSLADAALELRTGGDRRSPATAGEDVAGAALARPDARQHPMRKPR
jgi:hypothetical protein